MIDPEHAPLPHLPPTSRLPGPTRRAEFDRLATLLALIGVIGCVVRYALRFPLSSDESYLAINIIERDLAALFDPLAYRQTGPLLFLLAERVVIRAAGLNEWTLRLIPFLCAVGSIVLFRRLARAVLGSTPAFVLAVGFFANAYWLVRYSAEVKPYASDMLFTVAVLMLAWRWHGAARRGPVVVALVLLGLIGFACSLPSVFVGGGLALTMIAVAARRRDGPGVGHGLAVGAAFTVGFLVIFVVHTRGHLVADGSWMADYWTRAFPPLATPWRLPDWLLGHFTGEMLPYPIGGRRAGSSATFVCVAVGLIVAWRRGRRAGPILLAATLTLAFIAAALQRYPFGAPTRCQLYLAPMFCLAAGVGLAAGLAWIVDAARSRRLVRIVATIFIAVTTGSVLRDVASPAKTSTAQRIRDAARLVAGRGAGADRRVVSLRLDLGGTFTAEADLRQSALASYLCNLHIYREGPAVRDDWRDGVTVAAYLRGWRYNTAERAAWIDGFSDRHAVRLAGVASLPIPSVDNHERLVGYDRVFFMTFEPENAAARR